MTFLEALLLVAAVAALSWGWFYAGRRSMMGRVREAVTLFPPVIVRSDPTVELTAAHRLIEAQRLRIAVLESVRLEPPSPYTILPWQDVPARREVTFSEGLAQEVIELRHQLAQSEAKVADKDRLRKRYLTALNNIRPRLTAHLEHEVELRSRGVTVAKQIADRARDLTGALEDVQTHLLDAVEYEITIDEFYAGINQIFEQHQYAPTLTGAGV